MFSSGSKGIHPIGCTFLMLCLAIAVAMVSYQPTTSVTPASVQWSTGCSTPTHLFVGGEAHMECTVFGVNSAEEVELYSSFYVSVTDKTRTHVRYLSGDHSGNKAACPMSAVCFTATVKGKWPTPNLLRPELSDFAYIYVMLTSRPEAGKIKAGELQILKDDFGAGR